MIFWKYSVGGTTVEFNGVPFSIGGKRTMDCQYGHQYYKQRVASNKRVRLQGTRKVGCTAHITQREYTLYPEFVLPSSCKYKTKRQERLAKEEKLKHLRDQLRHQRVLKTKSVFFMSIPTEEAHHSTHHTRGANMMAQRVNPHIAAKISELVSEGMTDPYEVSKALKHYVTTIMCVSNDNPDPDDRAYYPTIRDLHNHIYKAKKALELSKLDQENLKLKIDEWRKSRPESVFHFQPFIKVEQCDENDLADSSHEQDFHQSLLWVHQTQWQKAILSKYGNTMTMIDATYKTTKYDVPLFFLTVRTNAGYIVVAEFIVQTETATHIQEALTILKGWNPTWHPNFIMCDYSEAEIMAMESAFPLTTVYICDFHREQCWERWVKDHKHRLSETEGAELLDLLRDCARASPSHSADQQPEDIFYHQAVSRLKDSQVWLQNDHVQNWLNNYWLSIPKVNFCLPVHFV